MKYDAPIKATISYGLKRMVEIEAGSEFHSLPFVDKCRRFVQKVNNP